MRPERAAAAAALVVALRAPGLAGADAPSTFVLKDGTEVTFAAPPETRGRALVGRLAGTGQLVSVPASAVDQERTRARAARPAAPATPAPTAPRPSSGQSLGDAGKLNRSPEEARRLLESARRADPAQRLEETEAVPGAAGKSPASRSEKDWQGRDQGYWADRARKVREQLGAARQELASARADRQAAEDAIPFGRSQGVWNTYGMAVNEARRREEAAAARVTELEGQLEKLSDEARKAGAPPGWIR